MNNSNEKYINILSELSDEMIGKDSIGFYSNEDNTRISINFKNNLGVKYGIHTIETENGYFILNAWRDIKFKFNSIDTFIDMAKQIIENIIKPAILELYKDNVISKIPEKMETPIINIDLSKITEEWLIEKFNEVSEEESNGEEMEEGIKIEKYYNLPSGASSASQKFEDGIKIEFSIDCGRRGVHRDNSIHINNKGKVNINLCEMLEGGGIESNLIEKIENYIFI